MTSMAHFSMPNSIRMSFSRTDAGLCIYHLFVWSNLNFLHNFQWITFPTQSFIIVVFVRFFLAFQQTESVGMFSCYSLLFVDRIFFRCFGKSCFVCIVLPFVDISLIFLFFCLLFLVYFLKLYCYFFLCCLFLFVPAYFSASLFFIILACFRSFIIWVSSRIPVFCVFWGDPNCLTN